MNTTVSRTALSMALFRAVETTRDEPRRLIDDPYAVHCLPPMYRAIARIARFRSLRRQVERVIDWRYPGARSSGVARTRLIDDWLVSETDGGLEQFVVLGAGFDSRYLRLRQLASIPTFELDRGSVLAQKKRAFESSVIGLPRNREAVAIDFLKDSIADKLLASDFRCGARNLVLWEGVTNYLTYPAVTSVLQTFATVSSPGTSIIFTYVHKGVLDSTFKTVGLQRLHRSLVRWGEPWTFGFQPEELPGFLANLGYELTNDVGATEYRQTYYGAAAAQIRGYEFYRVAKAKLITTESKIRRNTDASRRC